MNKNEKQAKLLPADINNILDKYGHLLQSYTGYRSITQFVMQALLNYNWPGNIRELKNVIKRLIVFSEQGTIKIEDLPFEVHESTEGKILDSEHSQLSLKEQLQKNEREIITRGLRRVRGNKKQCAGNLDITRATLYNRMRVLDIDI